MNAKAMLTAFYVLAAVLGAIFPVFSQQSPLDSEKSKQVVALVDKAAAMIDMFVPPEVAQERMQRLVEVVERSGQRKHEARIGRREQVLVEGPSKKDAAIWSGRTRQNKLVHFSPLEGSRAGDTIEVDVTGAAPHWLRGEAVARMRTAPT